MKPLFSKNTMRKVFLGSAIAVWTMCLAVVAHIVIVSFKVDSVIDWYGIGAFVLMLFTGLTSLAYMKKEQKKSELGIAKNQFVGKYEKDV